MRLAYIEVDANIGHLVEISDEEHRVLRLFLDGTPFEEMTEEDQWTFFDLLPSIDDDVDNMQDIVTRIEFLVHDKEA